MLHFCKIKSSLTECLELLLMLGSQCSVLMLVFGGLMSVTWCNDGFCSWFRSCILDRSNVDNDCCRRSFWCCCSRLLREAGRLRKSGVKALLTPGRVKKAATCLLPKKTCLEKQVFGFCVTLFVSSSSELENLFDERTAGLSVCEHFSGFGSQKWRVAERFCCELPNIIQYGGQDGCSPDEEGDC